MKIRILGCSGGIGGQDMRTTSMLVDQDILIDAGTGVGDLHVDELAQIDHVFLTHAHLDHIACLPFIPDTVGDRRSKPLTVYATQATQEVLKAHVFNWKIWPDFSEIPNKENPFMQFRTISLGEPVQLNGRSITSLPAKHTVPAVGYQIDSGRSSLVFTGDTTTCDELWDAVNKIANLRYLIIETAFSEKEKALANLSKHLCPSLLVDELRKMKAGPQIFLTHLKPGHVDVILSEIQQLLGEQAPGRLRNNQILEL
ncbi:MAG: 3',5'-cyclic-nucleotide phosphodiesterase [Burkholderiaceae bacterium]